MKRNTVAAIVFLLLMLPLPSPRSEDTSCNQLIDQSEDLWSKLDFDQSDTPLEQARARCPERVEIYWRLARNEYDRLEMIPRDKKPPKEELLKRYGNVKALAEQCIALDENDGNCWLWKAVGIGRTGSTQGILATIPLVSEMEKTLLKAIELKPQYKAENGAANAMADLHCMLGIFYRVLPEWVCAFPFRQIIGTCGDLDESVMHNRKSIEIEPRRIEFHKELGIALICRGQVRENEKDIREGRKILAALQDMNEFIPTDQMDKQHAMMILDDPSLACGYSRDAQQEQSKDAIPEELK
jgi:hypothetical protein